MHSFLLIHDYILCNEKIQLSYKPTLHNIGKSGQL